jgi:hypothetical protein
MRVHRFLLLFAGVLPSVPILTRALICVTALISFSLRVQAQASTTPSAQKDAQAMTILTQAVAALGGNTAISAVKDYSGTGTMIFHQSQTEQVNGTVTITGLGLGEFRMDSNLSTGTRSFSISQGRTHRKREDGKILHFPPTGPIPSSDAFPYATPIFPSGIGFPNQELIAAIGSSELSVSYKGLVQLDGHSVHDIQVQRILPVNPNQKAMAEYNAMDFFIDASTFQVSMTQDTVPKHVIHQIRYSDYRLQNGIVVPFSISEQLGGQRTWDIQLSQIGFNAGLQDSNFTL